MQSKKYGNGNGLDDPIIVSDSDEETSEVFQDFQEIDAEIIDYGVSEDEDEQTNFNSPVLIESHTTYSPVTASTKTKCVCIKLVDCNKYPWYYKKYKKQIFEWKRLNSTENVIHNHPENVPLTKEDVNRVHKNLPKIVPFINITKDIENRNAKLNNLNEKRNNKYKKDMESAIMLRKDTDIDLKKNKGLNGMKIQTIITDDKIKAKCEIKKKKVTHIESVSKHKGSEVTTPNINASSTVVGSAGTMTVPICNYTHKQLYRTAYSKEDHQTPDFEVNLALKHTLSTPIIINNKSVIYENSVNEQHQKYINDDNNIIQNTNHLTNMTYTTALNTTNNQNYQNNIHNVYKEKNMLHKIKDQIEVSEDFVKNKSPCQAMLKLKRVESDKWVIENKIINNNQDNNVGYPGLVTKNNDISNTATVYLNGNNENNDCVNSETYTLENNNELNLPNKSFYIMNKFTQKVLNKLQKPVKEDVIKRKVANKSADTNKSYPSGAMSLPVLPTVNDISNAKQRYSDNVRNKNMKLAIKSYINRTYDSHVVHNKKTSHIKKPKVSKPIYSQSYSESSSTTKKVMKINKPGSTNQESDTLSNSSNIIGYGVPIKGLPNMNSLIPRNQAGELVNSISKRLSAVTHQALKTTAPRQINPKRKQLVKILPVTNVQHYKDCMRLNESVGETLRSTSQESLNIRQDIPLNNDNMKTNHQVTIKAQSFVKPSQEVSNPQQQKVSNQTYEADFKQQQSNNCRQPTVNNIECRVYSDSLPQIRQVPIQIRPPVTANHMGQVTYTPMSMTPPYRSKPDLRANITPSSMSQLARTPKQRQQMPAKQDVYKQPHNINPLMNLQMMTMNVGNMNQDRINYMQNNYMYDIYTQQPIDSTFLESSSAYWPYDFALLFPSPLPQQAPPVLPPPPPPPPPPPLPPPPPPPQSNDTSNLFEHSSIIGKNTSGLVKKINIPFSPPITSNKDINNVKGSENKNNISKNTPPIPYDKKFTDNSTLAASKSEMMKELEKPIELESPVKCNLKRPCPSEKRLDQAKIVKYRPGPLSKKKLTIDNSITPQTAKQKQIPCKPYSHPILPIPTYVNILSEVQTPTFEKPPCEPRTKPSVKQKDCIFQMKPGQRNQIENKLDISKKISLEEYKMRTTDEGKYDKAFRLT